MKLFYCLSMILALSGCVEQKAARPPYPGKLPSYHTCHDLYDLGYEFDVLKCERDLENPKFKKGQKVKLRSGYDKSCRATIVAAWRWGWKPDEPIYAVKIYCNGKPHHDKHCEDGNTLNCPDLRESELK